MTVPTTSSQPDLATATKAVYQWNYAPEVIVKFALITGAFTAFCGVGVAWSVLRVAYPTFLLVKPDDFLAVHHLQEARIVEVLVSVVPLNIAATLSLLWLVPTGQRRWAMVALVGLLGVLVLAAAVQIPIHLRLDNVGADSKLLMRLVRNEWIRFGAGLVEALAYLALLSENL
jgi:hypothetical protein